MPQPPPEYVERTDYRPFVLRNRFLRVLGGLPLGLSVLSAICIASTVGEFLPHEDETSLKVVFHTWWFQSLLVLQGVNLIVNTWWTWVETTAPQFQPLFRTDPDHYKTLKFHHKAKFEKTAAADSRGLMESLARAFTARGYRAFFDGGAVYAHRGLIARFGSTVTHFGLLVIIAGALVEANFKTEGEVRLVEGDTADFYFQPDPDDPKAPLKKVPLDFEVHCRDFEFTQYPGTQTAQMFKSTVTFRPKEGEPEHTYVRVNHDEHFGGWTFHQSSYVPIDAKEWMPRFHVILREKGADGKVVKRHFETYVDPHNRQIVPIPGHDDRFFAVEEGVSGEHLWTVASKEGVLARGVLASTNLAIEMVRFLPDFARDESGLPYSKSDQPLNPAALVEVTAGGKLEMRQWVFRKDSPDYSREGGRSEIEFVIKDVKADEKAAAASPASDAALMGAVDGVAGATGAADASRYVVSVELEHKGGSTGRGFDLRVGEERSMAGEMDRSAEIAGDYEVESFHSIPAYMTIMSVSKNPGIPIVWWGAVFASLGPVLAFFVSRRRVWARVDWEKRTLWVGGESRYSREALEKEIAETLEEWSKSDEARVEPPIRAPGPAEVPRLSHHL